MRVSRSTSFPATLSNACLRQRPRYPGEASAPHPRVSSLLLGGTDSLIESVAFTSRTCRGVEASSWLSQHLAKETQPHSR